MSGIFSDNQNFNYSMSKLSFTTLSIAILSLLFLNCHSESSKALANLEEQILTELSELEGTFAISYQSITSPENSIFINENERFHAASTMKTPVMIEAFKQADEGKFSIDDSILIKTEFISIVDGSPFTLEINKESEPVLYEYVNKKLPIREVIDQMITVSSNLATNLMIDNVDAKKVTQTMRSLGADSIEVLRGVQDLKAFDLGMSNTTTAKDLRVIYKAMAMGNLISEQASSEMIEILKRQYWADMIPVNLPDNAEVAHKSGWITGVHHDSGIVYSPEGDIYVLVFLSKEAQDRDAVLEAAAKISKMIYDFETK